MLCMVIKATLLGLIITTSYGTQILPAAFTSNINQNSFNMVIGSDSRESIKNEQKSFSCVVSVEKNITYNISVDYARNLKKLKELTELSLYSSDEEIRFSSEFIKKISSILYSLKRQPEVFPNFLGNIQLEFIDNKNEEKYLEIEITPDLKMNIFKIDEYGQEYENDEYIDLDIDIINEEILNFYE